MGSTVAKTKKGNKVRKAPPGPRPPEPPPAPEPPSDELADALARLPEIAAETPPGLPVPAALAEAEEVAAAAARHSARLLAAPFDHDLLLTLPARIAALRDAEARWRIVRSRRAPRELARLRGEATLLRRDLLAAARFFLRADPEAQRELAAFAEGDSLAELAEDLRALADFVRRYGDGLALLDYPQGADAAAMRADELARSLSRGASDELVDEAAAEALAHRNRTFVLLDDAVREVRAAARFALRREPEALAAFRGGPGLGPRVVREPPIRLSHLG
jgi:hypothetical protein